MQGSEKAAWSGMKRDAGGGVGGGDSRKGQGIL